MATHLVLDASNVHAVVILTDVALVRHFVLWNKKEGDTTGPFGRARQAREDAVYNVVREVVLATRDKDLGAAWIVRRILMLSLHPH